MYCFYSSSFILWFLFLICMHLFWIFLFCMFFVFFYLFLFLCRPIAFPSHSKTQKINKSKIQTPKPRLKRTSALGQTQKLRPERLTINFWLKNWAVCPMFFFMFFSCHQSCVAFFLCGSLGFPSHRKTLKKKSREFPLGGPSPCGKQD